MWLDLDHLYLDVPWGVAVPQDRNVKFRQPAIDAGGNEHRDGNDSGLKQSDELEEVPVEPQNTAAVEVKQQAAHLHPEVHDDIDRKMLIRPFETASFP